MATVLLKYPEPALELAVCGLHMRGYPLEKQLLAHHALFVREDRTAPVYRFYLLPTTPAKPGLVRVDSGGVSIALEIWRIPTDQFGSFTALIPSPLGIGKVLLESGKEVCGFTCEGFAVKTARDISASGGWKNLFPAG